MVASWVMHVDLDEFIAAVEILRRPELADKPVVVGGRGDPTERGVVSTASYAAREFGVHSGMPLRTAARRCPEAVFVPVDREAYEAVSVEVMNTLQSMGLVVEVLGWDEAFVAVETDEPESYAMTIRHAILAATGLHCSVGIGDNKLRAKLATDFGKPRGSFRLTADNWYAVMADRPTHALWGIGKRTAKRLAALGIFTVRDLAQQDAHDLASELGPTMGPWYRRLARGVDTSPVDGTPYVPRGRGHEVTFQHNLTDWADVENELRRLAGLLADDLAREGRSALRIGIKVRYAPFITVSRSRKLTEPTAHRHVIVDTALALLAEHQDRAVRLLGVRAELADPADTPQSRING